MRTSDIAYVPHGTINIRPVPPLDEMSLQEISKRYLTTCVKSNGRVSECMRCKDKCPYGQKAVSIVYGTTDDRAVPYEGSMLQMARMQNELNRQRKETTESLTEELKKTEEEIETVEKEIKNAKRYRKSPDPEGWYEEALKSDDPVQYVVEHFDRTKTQAKKKLYNYLRLHPEMQEIHDKYMVKGVSLTKLDKESSVSPEPPVCVEKSPEIGKTEQPGDVYITRVMEMKLETLMNQQEEYESLIKSYQEKLLKVKEQIDTICKTMDILKTV